MSLPAAQHQEEIERNRQAWAAKPLLREIYHGFYARITACIDRSIPGRIVEIGSGIGNLKNYFAAAIATDLFPNPWLDLVCDGYRLPFRDSTLSHLILFDVFHHLRWPALFLSEARRVLRARGRLVLFEPYMSWLSFPVYGCFHHEPVGWSKPIDNGIPAVEGTDYYAAQGNATRVFFKASNPDLLRNWTLIHQEAFASFSYLLSGGFSKRALYNLSWLPRLQQVDARLSRFPRLFGARCLVVLASG